LPLEQFSWPVAPLKVRSGESGHLAGGPVSGDAVVAVRADGGSGGGVALAPEIALVPRAAHVAAEG
jgi:hypothetical protein